MFVGQMFLGQLGLEYWRYPHLSSLVTVRGRLCNSSRVQG